jgi:hypothetical protein
MATIKKSLKKAQTGATTSRRTNQQRYTDINKFETQLDSLRNEADRKYNDADKVMRFKKYARLKNKGKETPKTKAVDSLRSSAIGDVEKAVYKKMEIENEHRNMDTKFKKGGSIKKKMKNGGSLSGLTASNKRDKGTDVGGAWTKVQNKTLAGARGKAKLTKDKQLGATKMAKKGMSIKKK